MTKQVYQCVGIQFMNETTSLFRFQKANPEFQPNEEVTEQTPPSVLDLKIEVQAASGSYKHDKMYEITIEEKKV